MEWEVENVKTELGERHKTDSKESYSDCKLFFSDRSQKLLESFKKRSNRISLTLYKNAFGITLNADYREVRIKALRAMKGLLP